MFPTKTQDEPSVSAEESNDRTGNGGNDEQKHHHRHRAVLILIVERRSEKAVPSDGLGKISSFLKLRSWPSWDPLTLANFATHGIHER